MRYLFESKSQHVPPVALPFFFTNSERSISSAKLTARRGRWPIVRMALKRLRSCCVVEDGGGMRCWVSASNRPALTFTPWIIGRRGGWTFGWCPHAFIGPEGSALLLDRGSKPICPHQFVPIFWEILRPKGPKHSWLRLREGCSHAEGWRDFCKEFACGRSRRKKMVESEANKLTKHERLYRRLAGQLWDLVSSA